MSDWLSQIEEEKRQREEPQRLKQEQERRSLEAEQQRILDNFLLHEKDFVQLHQELAQYTDRASKAGIPVRILRDNFRGTVYALEIRFMGTNTHINIHLEGENCVVSYSKGTMERSLGGSLPNKIVKVEKFGLHSISTKQFETWIRWIHENQEHMKVGVGCCVLLFFINFSGLLLYLYLRL
jgi:hypothetical protein